VVWCSGGDFGCRDRTSGSEDFFRVEFRIRVTGPSNSSPSIVSPAAVFLTLPALVLADFGFEAGRDALGSASANGLFARGIRASGGQGLPNDGKKIDRGRRNWNRRDSVVMRLWWGC